MESLKVNEEIKPQLYQLKIWLKNSSRNRNYCCSENPTSEIMRKKKKF